MTYTQGSDPLRIQLNTKGCELSPVDISGMEEDLHTLRRVVECFPVANLNITIVRHARPQDYHVKLSLVLTKRTLFTGDRDTAVHPAYSRCIRKLVKKVQAYKQSMRGEEDQRKRVVGTQRDVQPTQTIDVDGLARAVADDNYQEFRRSADVFAPALAERIGRWIERYPAIESRLGEEMTITDIVEDVFLHAFEDFSGRPLDVPPGVWLEALIDPAVQALLQSPDEEFANISFSKAAFES